jgi:hypothetical protein
MSDRVEAAHGPRDGRTQRVIRIAAVASVLVHALLLWGLPRMRLPALDPAQWKDADRSLSVHLAPLARPPTPPPSARTARPPAPAPARPPQAAPPPPSPPVIARKPPAQELPLRIRPQEGGDLSAYIEEKRRARAESQPAPAPRAAVAPPVEDEDARRDRIAAANLALPAPAFGYDLQRKGGAFQIQRIGYDDAEFIFYGWDKEARRNMARLVEVRRGSHSDIRIAVVRRMIAIIRDHEQGDFLWESSRLRHNVTLSARPRDNARLEEFMMEEFFGDRRTGR